MFKLFCVSMHVVNKKDKEKRKCILASLFYFFTLFLVEFGAKEWILQTELKMCM